MFEVSTMNDDKEGNAIHVWSAADGRELWSRVYVPGQQHMKQARAMFAGGSLWILEHLKCVGLDPLTGALEDPFDGMGDLGRRLLRAVDPATFGDDPLRALRVPLLGRLLS